MNRVALATSAAAAISLTVTASNPRSANNRSAASAIRRRVHSFFRSRNPATRAPYQTGYETRPGPAIGYAALTGNGFAVWARHRRIGRVGLPRGRDRRVPPRPRWLRRT